MTPNEPTPPQPPPSNRVTVVDFDMPFGSMIVFMLKWALASIPAMLILLVLGGIFVVLITGALAGLGVASRASMFSRGAEPDASDSLPPLVVTLRQTANGWQVINGTSVTWQRCSLSVSGHSASIARLAGDGSVELPPSAFSNGGLSPTASFGERDVSASCASPESRQARIYLRR